MIVRGYLQTFVDLFDIGHNRSKYINNRYQYLYFVIITNAEKKLCYTCTCSYLKLKRFKHHRKILTNLKYERRHLHFISTHLKPVSKSLGSENKVKEGTDYF